jgi:hypothetical protein
MRGAIANLAGAFGHIQIDKSNNEKEERLP